MVDRIVKAVCPVCNLSQTFYLTEEEQRRYNAKVQRDIPMAPEDVFPKRMPQERDLILGGAFSSCYSSLINTLQLSLAV